MSYLAGLVESLRFRGLLEGGLDMAVTGTVPVGSGLSSSAALEIAAALALLRSFGFELESRPLAELCQEVEHVWAGVRCGIMDQLACLLGQPGHALLIDCRDITTRQVPLALGEHVLLVTDSGVRRGLAGSAYNQRRLECELGVESLRRHAPSLRSLRDVSAEMLAAHAAELPSTVARRCRHVVEENARVHAAELALRSGDLASFGELMNRSHDSLRVLYEASHPLVDRLVEAARAVPGVLGSRVTGAGWGGCTVTLCTRAAEPEFRRRMESLLGASDGVGPVLPVGEPVGAGVVESG